VPTPAAAPAAPAAPGAGFSADAISSILGNLAAQAPPVAINEVIRPEATAGAVDAAMESQLSEHLPATAAGSLPESVSNTLSTPQLQQAATDASSASATQNAMDVEAKPAPAPAPDKMDES